MYVELEVTPWIWRLQSLGDATAPVITPHTGGAAVALHGCWLDENGHLYLETDIGFGLVHSLDMLVAAEAVEAGLWQPQECLAAELPKRFGYRLKPRPAGASA